MAYFHLLDFSMTFHHFVCISGMVITVTQGISSNYLVAGLFISEVSNPMMHARMIIKHLGLRYTKAYEVSELGYILLYVYGRILIGTSVVIRTVTCQENHFFIKLLCVGLAF